MAILKKTTVVAKPAAKTKSNIMKALSKGLSESMMEAKNIKPATKAIMKARAEEVFKAGKVGGLKGTVREGFVSIDKKTGKETKSPMSAPKPMKFTAITEKEFNMDTPKPKKKK
jgi:hypothetical protein